MSTTLLLAGLLLLAACDEWHLSVNSDGLVFISIIGDQAGAGNRFRFRVRDDGGNIRTLDVPPSGQLTLTPEEGSLQLTLLTPDDCRVVGANPQTLTVTAGGQTSVAFGVRCG